MIAFAQPCRIRDGVSSNAMRLPMYFVTGDRLIEIADIFQSSIPMVLKGVLRKNRQADSMELTITGMPWQMYHVICMLYLQAMCVAKR